MNCKHCFCIPFEWGKGALNIVIKKDFQCCKCGKAKHGLTKQEKKKLKEMKKSDITKFSDMGYYIFRVQRCGRFEEIVLRKKGDRGR